MSYIFVYPDSREEALSRTDQINAVEGGWVMRYRKRGIVTRFRNESSFPLGPDCRIWNKLGPLDAKPFLEVSERFRQTSSSVCMMPVPLEVLLCFSCVMQSRMGNGEVYLNSKGYFLNLEGG